MANILVVSLSPTIQKTLKFNGGWKRNEVNRTPHSLLSASGKGANTARIIAQGGETVTLLSQTGGNLSEFFINNLESSGVKMVTEDSGKDIRFCYTLIEPEPFSATELVEEGEPVSPALEKGIRKKFTGELDNTKFLIIAGSASPGFSPDIYSDFIMEAGKKKIPMVIDRHGPLLLKILDAGPLIVKINLYEFLISYLPEHNWSQDVKEDFYDIIIKKGRELNRIYGHRFVLTNGERDTLIIDDENITRLTPEMRKPVNPIGCGDAVTAGTAVGLNQGLPLKEAVDMGMHWAALNLEKLAPGTIL